MLDTNTYIHMITDRVPNHMPDAWRPRAVADHSI
jgi:hypothetical protein